MKKVLSVLAGAIALFGFASFAFASPFDYYVQSLDSTGLATTTTTITPQTYSGAFTFPVFVGNGDSSGWQEFGLGSGIATGGNTISVTPFSIETTDGHLNDTLDIVNTSLSSLFGSVSSLFTQVGALGAPLNIAAFMGNNASTSPFIASSSQNGFLSSLDKVKLDSINTRSVATSSRSIVTGTGATGFQVSSTRDSEVRYSTTIVTTSNIAGSQNGTVVLEIAPTNSATSTVWSEIGRCTNGTSYTLAIAIQGVSTQACQITGYVPAGYFAKIRSINNAGTPSFSFNSGQEVLQ